jgi:hypothetical protein
VLATANTCGIVKGYQRWEFQPWVEAQVDIAVDLVVTGIDLGDEDVLAALADGLDDLGWLEIDDRVLVTVYVDKDADLVSAVIDAAHRIEHAIEGARCVRVDEDLVGTSDIAARTGMTREAIRLWVLGKRGPGGFPMTRGTAGSGRNSVRLWAWRDVVPWLNEHYGLCVDEHVVSCRDVAEIDGHLQRVDHSIDHEWHRLGQPKVSADVFMGLLTPLPTVVSMKAGHCESSRRPAADEAGFVSLYSRDV